MKGFLLFVFYCLLLYDVNGQELSAKDFLFPSSFSPKKFESYLNRKNFLLTGSRMQRDTLVNVYRLKPVKRKKPIQEVTRRVETYQSKDNFSFAYFTSSEKDYKESFKELKEEGFFCGNEGSACNIFFQKRNVSVLANMLKPTEDDTLYSMVFSLANLPQAENIQYAEDLLQFYSHEHLLTVFGEKNVIRDVYYFSPNEISKCSVLFPKTKQQAVFIWEDEDNLCRLSSVLTGGNVNTASSVNYDGLIEENIWRSKQGVYSGMSLSKLIRLNGNDFKFYGKNSRFPFMVVPENTGTLNFKKSIVVLGCLNATGSKLLNRELISANEILYDNPGMYVFMMMFSPVAEAGLNK